MAELKAERQQLRDEVNRLKGEHGAPKFKRKKSVTRQPLPGTEQPESTKDKAEESEPKKRKDRIKIDRQVKLTINPQDMPADAVFKGYHYLIQQELRLVRDNVRYQLPVYYSAVEQRSYRAVLPDDYRGQYGYSLVGLTQLLSHFGDMTNDRLLQLYHSLGIVISSATINNMQLDHGSWVLDERHDILKAGLATSPFQQMDATRTFESGEVRNTQVVCGQHYKVFYTRKGRKRVDVISVLQGLDGEQVKLCYNHVARHFLNKLPVAQPDRLSVGRLLEKGKVYGLTQLWSILDKDARLAAAKPALRSKINDALALGHYYSQKDFALVDVLLSDGAKEYMMVARRRQAVCWLHDIRDYRKMTPQLSAHRKILDEFIDKLWQFYGRLKSYRQKNSVLAQVLRDDFDKLFGAPCDYRALAKRMERTLANKDRLLVRLDKPFVPLHNNSAERGMRRVVRKRDISLHTTSDRGTSIKDGFLSVVETARKLNVNVLEYIDAKVRGLTIQYSLAELVIMKYQKPTLNL